MSTWASDLDVLADLDRLSEFSAGSPSTQSIDISSPSSYGRGNYRAVQHEEYETTVGKKDTDYCLPALPSFTPGSGRGERILALSRINHDTSLQRQLRMAMGPGYSNELIENFIRGECESSNDQACEVGQFDDHNSSEVPVAEPTPIQQEDSVSSSSTHPSREHTFSPTAEEQELGASSKEVNSDDPLKVHDKMPEVSKKSAKKSYRCRNALLNSLPSYKNSSITDIPTDRSKKSSSPKQDVENSFDEMKSVPSYSKHKAENTSTKSEMSKRLSPNWLKRDDSFVYKDEDFPPL